MLILHADGGCWPNPGSASYGVVAKVDGVTVAELGEAIGYATNNVAEWRGAVAALEYALESGHTYVELHMDSLLVIQQLNGRWRVKNEGLKPFASEAARLIDLLKHRGVRLTMRWVSRTRNYQADRVASDALYDTHAPCWHRPPVRPDARKVRHV